MYRLRDREEGDKETDWFEVVEGREEREGEGGMEEGMVVGGSERKGRE